VVARCGASLLCPGLFREAKYNALVGVEEEGSQRRYRTGDPSVSYSFASLALFKE
jgi:hypothetical protein